MQFLSYHELDAFGRLGHKEASDSIHFHADILPSTYNSTVVNDVDDDDDDKSEVNDMD